MPKPQKWEPAISPNATLEYDFKYWKGEENVLIKQQ